MLQAKISVGERGKVVGGFPVPRVALCQVLLHREHRRRLLDTARLKARSKQEVSKMNVHGERDSSIVTAPFRVRSGYVPATLRLFSGFACMQQDKPHGHSLASRGVSTIFRSAVTSSI